MNYVDETLAIARGIEIAGDEALGNVAQGELWTKRQILEVIAQCGVLTHALPASPEEDFKACAEVCRGAFFIIYNEDLSDQDARLYMIGELAAVIAMRDYSDRYCREPDFPNRIATAIRQMVGIVSIMICPELALRQPHPIIKTRSDLISTLVDLKVRSYNGAILIEDIERSFHPSDASKIKRALLQIEVSRNLPPD